MDSRNTLSVNETFLHILENLALSKSHVAMLLDCKGMIRAEGIIDKIITDNKHPYLVMTNGNKIAIETVIAVYVIFSPAYAEC